VALFCLFTTEGLALQGREEVRGTERVPFEGWLLRDAVSGSYWVT